MEHPLQGLKEYEALKLILEGTSRETGREFFRALVKALASALRTQGAWVTQLDSGAGRARFLCSVAQRRVGR